MAELDDVPRSPEHEGWRLEFETLISDLSSRFINLPPGEVDGEIEDALRRVCELLGIDLAVLWQWSAVTPDIIEPTHAYPTLGALQPPEPLHQEQFPWLAAADPGRPRRSPCLHSRSSRRRPPSTASPAAYSVSSRI